MISLTNEYTDSKGRHARGWLFYDANCNFCIRITRFLSPILGKRGLAVAPLQDPRVAPLLGIPTSEIVRELKFLLSDGQQFGGANAVLSIAAEIPWARPLVWFSRLPGGMRLLHRAYRCVAANRSCASVSCPIGPQGRSTWTT